MYINFEHADRGMRYRTLQLTKKQKQIITSFTVLNTLKAVICSVINSWCI